MARSVRSKRQKHNNTVKREKIEKGYEKLRSERIAEKMQKVLEASTVDDVEMAELKPLVADMVANPSEVKVTVAVEEEPTSAMEVVAELTNKTKLTKVKGGIQKRKKVGRK